jgi:hypothetical protein
VMKEPVAGFVPIATVPMELNLSLASIVLAMVLPVRSVVPNHPFHVWTTIVEDARPFTLMPLGARSAIRPPQCPCAPTIRTVKTTSTAQVVCAVPREIVVTFWIALIHPTCLPPSCVSDT